MTPEIARNVHGIPMAEIDGYFYGVIKHQRWLVGRRYRDYSEADSYTEFDFVPYSFQFDTEEDAIADLQDIIQHYNELNDLPPRTKIDGGTETPWGCADYGQQYAEGVVCYSTPSHAGFCVSPEQNGLIPEIYRREDGWYEHHIEWAKIAAAFPSLFTQREQRDADATLRNERPDEYEALHGIVLPIEQSRVKKNRQFYVDNADKWINIAGSNTSNGMVLVTATLGGQRNTLHHRKFVVPRNEYEANYTRFVIDPERHEEVPQRGLTPLLEAGNTGVVL